MSGVCLLLIEHTLDIDPSPLRHQQSVMQLHVRGNFSTARRAMQQTSISQATTHRTRSLALRVPAAEVSPAFKKLPKARHASAVQNSAHDPVEAKRTVVPVHDHLSKLDNFRSHSSCDACLAKRSWCD